MKQALTLVSLALLLPTASLAGVNYYFTDNLHSIDPMKWTAGGLLRANAFGLAAPAPNSGGALISRVPIPDGSSEAEVLATHFGGC